MAKIEQLPIAHLVNPDPIELRAENLIDLLEKKAKTDRTALTFLDRQNAETHLTYKGMLERARTVANFLKNRGLRPGEKVILILLTNEEFVDCFFGTMMAGGIPVAVNPPITFGDIRKYLLNLSHILQNSEAKFMIAFPRIRKVIGSVLAADNQLREFLTPKDIVAEPPTTLPGLPSIDPKSTAFIQYTSGSTGIPKGAELSHRALLSNVAGIANGIDCHEGDVSVSWLPLFHDMGLIGSLLTALYSGTHLYTMLPEAFVMNPLSWLQNISKYRATIATAPNFAYHLLATRISEEELSALDLCSLKVALNGAEPVDLRTLEAFHQKFGNVGYRENVSFPVYGMAENCLAATFPRLHGMVEIEQLDRDMLDVNRIARRAADNDPFPVQVVSVGGPILGQEVAILGDRGGYAREDEVGEILVKSPSLMTGYHNNPEATEAVLRDGWLHTGDLGFINRGRLFITGRAKEMIIKRGRNYYPYDIERAASSVPGVRKGCMVAFSAPNLETGTEDLIVVAESREVDAARRDEVSRSIAGEILSTVGIRPDATILVPPRTIPKTSSGKLQRLLTRQRYLDGTLLQGMTDRLMTPVKTLVGSFIGNQRFRLRAR